MIFKKRIREQFSAASINFSQSINIFAVSSHTAMPFLMSGQKNCTTVIVCSFVSCLGWQLGQQYSVNFRGLQSQGDFSKQPYIGVISKCNY